MKTTGDTDPSVRYEHTDKQALAVGDGAARFILDNDVKGFPLRPRGVRVYGIIAALRENDAEIYDETHPDFEGRVSRAQAVESLVDAAVGADLQFYPFGHQRDAYVVDTHDREARQRAAMYHSPVVAVKSGYDAKHLHMSAVKIAENLANA